MVFSVFHCKIKLSFSFILMLSFSLLLGSEKLLSVLLFASLHELGHLSLLLLFGGRPDTVTLAFYGIGMTHSVPLSRSREVLFLTGGIAVNLLFILLHIERDINAALFCINALPLYPLDMGRVMALYLPYRLCRFISVLIPIILLTAGLFLKNISLLLIAVYMIAFSFKEELR